MCVCVCERESEWKHVLEKQSQCRKRNILFLLISLFISFIINTVLRHRTDNIKSSIIPWRGWRGVSSVSSPWFKSLHSLYVNDSSGTLLLPRPIYESQLINTVLHSCIYNPVSPLAPCKCHINSWRGFASPKCSPGGYYRGAKPNEPQGLRSNFNKKNQKKQTNFFLTSRCLCWFCCTFLYGSEEPCSTVPSY